MYDKLTALCKKMGYHGICPEALTEIRDALPEYQSFMAAAREMFAPAVTPVPTQTREKIVNGFKNAEYRFGVASQMLQTTGMTPEEANEHLDTVLSGMRAESIASRAGRAYEEHD